MLYDLSKFIPVRMQSTYDRSIDGCGPFLPEHASWWQWRGHIFRHRVTPLSLPL